MIRGVSRGLIRAGIASLLAGVVLKSFKSRRRIQEDVVSDVAASATIYDSSAPPTEPTAGVAEPSTRFRTVWHRAHDKMWSTRTWKIITALILLSLVITAAVMTGLMNWPWEYLRSYGAIAGATPQNQSYPLTETLLVSFPGSGTLATNQPNRVTWAPTGDENNAIQIFKATYEQDNFVADARKKLVDAGASRIEEGKIGAWTYVMGHKDGNVPFYAYSNPLHAAGSFQTEHDVKAALARTIVSKHAIDPATLSAQSQGSWGRSSGSSGSGTERGFSGSWGS